MKARILIAIFSAAVLLVSGCARTQDQTAEQGGGGGANPSTEDSAGVAADPDGNFVLSVSNQSFEIDSVDIIVTIDGQPVIDEDFAVEDQHNWKQFTFRLDPGRHTLTARSQRGGAELERTFEVTGEHWAVINYWYSDGTNGTQQPKELKFDIQDEPIGFL